jgi:mRNA interferase RelE/StbE
LPTRIEWNSDAREQFRRLDHTIQQRIGKALGRLALLDDPEQRLIPYREELAGLWKLRVGDYRVICDLLRDDAGRIVLVVHMVHRSKAYLPRNIANLRRRRDD